ncbi:Transposase IS4 [Fragilaria crotonensis]|nr:Transposase IS4 [Fragilaria crotonensis]
MDSGFCVIDAILNLASVGIFSSAVIKKRRYWPKYIDGEAIDQYFVGKTVGSVEALPGSVGGKAFRLFAMKEEDYVMKLMTTYGSCIEINDGWTQRSILENGRRVTKKFKYYEPFHNHLKFRHKVDDHNNLRHSPISLEASLSTKDWKIRVFTFILALVEVNARLAYAYFSGSELLNQIEFRRKLAKELLDYSYQVRGQRRVHEGLCASTCGEETAPRFAGQWTGTEWTQLATMYPQHVCKTYNCTRRIRTYCRCKIGYWLCPTCIGIHIASKENYNGVDD